MDIYEIQTVDPEMRGQGYGTRFMQQAQAYCQLMGKRLEVSHVTNEGFFNRFDFLTRTPQRRDAPRYIYDPSTPPPTTAKVILHEPCVEPCPTCKGPMTDGFCPQCQWSPLNPNLDSDPLSNPPDPTVDMHRGIQARVIPSHRWAKWFDAVDEL